MNKIIIYLALLLATGVLEGCINYSSVERAQVNEKQITKPAIEQTETFNYQDYASILSSYVDNRGLVNYSELQANRKLLDNFNQSLAQVNSVTYESWSEAEKLAFLINAYNALTLQSIIDQKPLKQTIRDIPGVWKSRKFQVAGNSKTLDNIEHDTIRKNFDEPRIHVALVCAAMSCPPLRNEPYLAETLEQQLDDQVNKFIASEHGFKLERHKNTVSLSSIFKWYGKDWINSYGIQDRFTGNKKEKAVLNFISDYLSSEEQQYLKTGMYKVAYLNYDWSLNQQ